MEEIVSIIFDGFKQVKDLESNLPRLLVEQQREALSSSINEITRTFGAANERLKVVLNNNNNNSQMPTSAPAPASESVGPEQLLMHMDQSLMQEYFLRCSVTQAMDAVIQAQLMARGKTPFEREGSAHIQMASEERGAVQVMHEADPGRGTASSSRPRRRKEEEEVQTMLIPAPRMGNTEIPPDDNYTWRKYGQKEILGSRFPRAYYRCTHQKLYNCPAKKQVQRLDNDPFTFQVTYRGAHTCHIAATAPSSAPMRYGKEAEYPAVADMADAMFNSGSSSGNSMDLIFTSHHHQQGEDKWEQGDKRN